MKFPGINLGFNAGTFALGAAALLFGPMLIAIAGGLVKSAAKAGIKGGLMMYDKGKELAAEAKETVEDLTAEAKAEMKQSQVSPVKKKAA
jgi:hypothetical protein